MCHIKRTIAGECGHPIVWDVERCEWAKAHGVDQCDPDDPDLEVTLDDSEVVEGKCNFCQQADNEREEAQQTRAVQEASREDAERRETEQLNTVREESRDDIEAQHDAELERAMQASREDARARQQSHDAEYETQLDRVLREAAQEYEQNNDDGLEEDLKRALELSIQNSLQQGLDAEVPQAPTASEETAPRGDLDSSYIEDEDLNRVLGESLDAYERNPDTAGVSDDDPRLREVLQRSMHERHAPVQRDPPKSPF